MLARRVINCVKRSSLVSGELRPLLSLSTTTSTANTPSDEEPKRAVRKLKEWRKRPEIHSSPLEMFIPPKPKNKPLVMPRTVFRLPPGELRQWWRGKKVDFAKFDQQFIEQRHRTLGCDLAAAHFLVHRNGKVKFYGQSEWIMKDEEGFYNELPSIFHASWQLTDVDASGVPLHYEGIENFLNLYRVNWASFRDNPNLDDWCVDHIVAHFRNIEHLDISGCKNVTERALEAIYKLLNLKTLIITDWHKLPSFELSCAMLEDCNPNLTIEIRESGEENKKEAQT